MKRSIEYDARPLLNLKLDRHTRTEIFDYMNQRIAGAENPRLFGKPLRHSKFGLWRYRVPRYRIICELQDTQFVVLVVA